jgi:lipoprotein NlpI
VTRAGKVMDRTREVKFDLLQRETNLEKNLYDGDVTAVAILPDIRVGDIVEFERSIIGANPIFRGRISHRYPINYIHPVEAYRQITLYPKTMKLHFRAPGWVRERNESLSDREVHTWEASKVPPITDDRDRPRWHDPVAWVEVSQFNDWREVESWAADLFKVDGALAPELRKVAESWRTSGQPPEQIVAEALRWTQSEIRYFGIEIGVNSHLPGHPNATFARRFGDCKDKSLLLSSLLNEIGIKAHPALVSVERNRSVDRLLPGPAAFDHAIVRVELNGKTYWLDPSMPPQYGALSALGAFDYGKALVVGDGKGDLTRSGTPEGYVDHMNVTDRFEVSDFKQPVLLVSELTATHASADRLRAMRSDWPKGEMERHFQSQYLAYYPGAEPEGEVEIQDDTTNNRLTMVRRYRLSQLVDYSQGRFQIKLISPLILDVLSAPSLSKRETPFALPFPFEAGITQIIQLPDNPVRNVPSPSNDRSPHFLVNSNFKSDEKALRRDIRISLLRDHVAPEQTPAFSDEIHKHRSNLNTVLTLRVGILSEQEKRQLQSELSPFDRYGRSRSPALGAQVDAYIGIRQLGVDIHSGKLSPRHLAKAYAERAIHHDNLDQVDQAIQDISKAIELDPNETEHQLAKARILSFNGKNTEALDLFTRLEQNPQASFNKSDYSAMAQSLYYLGRYEEAAKKFEVAMESGNWEGNLIQLYWQHFSASRSGKSRSLLKERIQGESRRDWPYAIGEMLTGRIDRAELLRAARHEDRGIERDQLAEAYFYLGQKALLDGQRDEAARLFDETIDLGVTPFLEYKRGVQERAKFGERPKGLLNWLKNL